MLLERIERHSDASGAASFIKSSSVLRREADIRSLTDLRSVCFVFRCRCAGFVSRCERNGSYQKLVHVVVSVAGSCSVLVSRTVVPVSLLQKTKFVHKDTKNEMSNNNDKE